jgi:hemoglobin-like flavoprotein
MIDVAHVCGHEAGTNMTKEEIALVQATYRQLSSRLGEIGPAFYERLFAEHPPLRALFPVDLSIQESHFEAALALIFRNLHEMEAIEAPLMKLGGDHVVYGARPADYLLVRRVLLEVLAAHADPAWTPEVARAWWNSVTTVLHWMLRGAAVATAVAAEQLLDSEAAPIDTRTAN